MNWFKFSRNWFNSCSRTSKCDTVTQQSEQYIEFFFVFCACHLCLLFLHFFVCFLFCLLCLLCFIMPCFVMLCFARYSSVFFACPFDLVRVFFDIATIVAILLFCIDINISVGLFGMNTKTKGYYTVFVLYCLYMMN